MNRFLIHFLSGAVLAFSLAAPILAQETFAYPEDFPPRALQTVDGVSYSLAPTGSSAGKSASVSGNSVTLNSGTIDGGVSGAVNLNDSSAVTDNHVTINNGTVKKSVDGGRGATASGNSVTVNSGAMGLNVIGGHGRSASAQVSTASGNRVIINGGTFYDIYGGLAQSDSNATATNNSVTINGGVINGNVVGGDASSTSGGFSSNYSVTNNTVTIRGTPTFGSSASLWGGSPYYSASVGNTLNLHSAGLTVRQLMSFQNLNFYLPATLMTGGTMLTATQGTLIPPNVTINVGLEGAGPVLRTGDRFILVASDSMIYDIPPTTGVVGGYAYTVKKEGYNLVLTIGDRQSSDVGPTREYTGQWIKIDDSGNNDENAWGLSVLSNFYNSRYIFIPWYTYDSTGKASWYIFEGDNWSANDKITADVYRYEGSPWGTIPYDNSRVTRKVVGTATMTFTSATSAAFQYNVEGVNRTINLAPIDNVPLLSAAYTGQWIKADANGRNDEDAWGLTVLRGFQSNPDYVFVPWYTYDSTGKASWYIFQNTIVGNTVTAEVYRYTGSPWGTIPFDNSKIDSKVVGNAKLTFTSTTKAKFEYDVEGVNRTIDLIKLE